jgi:hypothetical protein
MTDPKQSPRSGGLRLYFLFSVACGAVLALGAVAFRADAELAGRLHAKGMTAHDTIAAVHAGPRVAALNSIDNPAESLTGQKQHSPAQIGTALVAHPPVKLIARVDDTLVAAVSEAQPVEPVGSDEDELAGTTAWTPPKGDTYRTVCVRLCDGAMVPVSFSTRRGRFLKDAERCAQQCGSPSRLFVYPTAGSPDDMVDMDGRAYRDLPTAYKFRTDYDAACGCRAQPWETAALDQHRAWALAQAATPDGPKSNAQQTVTGVDVAVAEARHNRQVDQPAVVASLEVATPTPSTPFEDVAKPLQSEPTSVSKSVGSMIKSKLKPVDVVVASRPHSKLLRKPERTTVAVASPVARSTVGKQPVVVVKAKAPKAEPVVVATVRPAPKLVQRQPVQVAEMVSHRKTGTQRSFRGDDWRLSVWVPQ